MKGMTKVKVPVRLLLDVGLVLISLPKQVWCATPFPRRVAVISSSGVDNDFRSWNEYDTVLRSLGWDFDKYRNTALEKFFAQSQKYDLVLTTSLWNYGDPVDMSSLACHWEGYLKAGGILIVTDMGYPPMGDWLGRWRRDLFIEYGDAFKDLGSERAAMDLSDRSPFLSSPHLVGAFPYWAHFRKWGGGYKVWAKTRGGTAIGLVSQIGQGILIVTTGWAFHREMLENLLTNAVWLKTGLSIEWFKPPTEIRPGRFTATIVCKNLRSDNITVPLEVFLRRKDGSRVSQVKVVPVALSPRAVKSFSVTIPVTTRGALEAVVRCRPSDLTGAIEIAHSFWVPPLIELSLRRSIFTLSDPIEIRVRVSPPEGLPASCKVSVKNDAGTAVRTFTAADGRQAVTLWGRTLGPGRFRMDAKAEVKGGDGEKGSATLPFQIVPLEKPPCASQIGERGELRINGSPVFPIGTYHVALEDLKTIRALGFNCVTGPIYGGDQSALTDDQKRWHDEAHRQRLWVINELSEFIRSGRKNFTEALQVISWLRVHPASIVHYAIDEPQGGAISRELVQQFCHLIKEADPEHPTLVNEVPGAVINYTGIADITATDPYPIGSAVPEDLNWVGQSVRDVVAASKGRTVWAVIQSHRQPPPHSKNRYPTPKEIRCMAYLALNNGAKGLLFYAWDDVYHTDRGDWFSGFKYNDELIRFFQKFNRELAQMGLHYMLGRRRPGAITIQPGGTPLKAVWLEHSQLQMAVIVNPTSRTVRARVRSPFESDEMEFKPLEVKILRRCAPDE